MKKGKQSFIFDNVYIRETATVVGPTEGEGPLGKYFDEVVLDHRLGMDSFEAAEIMFQQKALKTLLNKSELKEETIDFVFAGDLINQDAISNYTMRNYSIPFAGIYGACSTSVLGLLLSAIVIEGDNANNIIALTSSHNSSSERQFRNPNEYGGAKPYTSTYTVTGSSAAIISKAKSRVRISGGTMGMVIDVGFKNGADMGRAMAPAAVETILTHMHDFGRKPSDYDLIVTGDLSKLGSEIVATMLHERFTSLFNYNDCGLMIFDINKQKVFSGGSGCACCGVVSMGFIFKKIYDGTYKRVLVCATGALLNPQMMLQKESVPGICHAIVLEAVE